MRDLRRRCVISERAGLFTHIDPHENGAIPVSASQRQSRMFSEILGSYMAHIVSRPACHEERVMKMMWLIPVATVVSLTASPGFAQHQRGPNTTYAGHSDVPPSHRFVPERDECLFNKVTKKRECHSRAEWRKIAAKLAAQRDQAQQR
jgi:hypothetical protein